jgi:hypothetical protein
VAAPGEGEADGGDENTPESTDGPLVAFCGWITVTSLAAGRSALKSPFGS